MSHHLMPICSKALAHISDANTDESDAIKKYFDLLANLHEVYCCLKQSNHPKAEEMEDLICEIEERIIPEEQAHMRILEKAIEELSEIYPEH